MENSDFLNMYQNSGVFRDFVEEDLKNDFWKWSKHFAGSVPIGPVQGDGFKSIHFRPQQRRCLNFMMKCIRHGKDLGIKKSQGEGFSWMVTNLAFWLAFSKENNRILILEETPFGAEMSIKMMCLINSLPECLRGQVDFHFEPLGEDESILKMKNGSEIVFCCADLRWDQKYQWDRFSVAFFDNFADWDMKRQFESVVSIQQACGSMIAGSCVNGPDNCFEKMFALRGYELRWQDNPARTKISYWVNPEGEIQFEHEHNKNLEGPVKERLRELVKRGYVVRGMRSDWYDEICRKETPQYVAAKYDCDSEVTLI